MDMDARGGIQEEQQRLADVVRSESGISVTNYIHLKGYEMECPEIDENLPRHYILSLRRLRMDGKLSNADDNC